MSKHEVNASVILVHETFFLFISYFSSCFSKKQNNSIEHQVLLVAA